MQCRRPRFNSWVGKFCWRRDRLPTPVFLGFPGGSAVKESACNVGDLSSIPRLGRSLGEENSYPHQYSGLENSLDWTVHGVPKSWTWLSDFHFHFQLRESFLYLLPSLTACCKEKAYFEISSVQSLSHVLLFATPWTAARQASLSITNFQNLLKLMSIQLVMPSSPLILCRPLLLLPSTLPSIRVFFSEWSLRVNQGAKILELQLQHQPFQRIFSSHQILLIMFRIPKVFTMDCIFFFFCSQ